jgi:ferrous-iron efflux pump FieF
MKPAANDIGQAESAATVRTGRLMRAATYASLTVATILVLAKVGAWLATDSVSLLSTLVDSLLDIGASGLTFLAVRQATQPADHDHRFGHGKAESRADWARRLSCSARASSCWCRRFTG